MEPLKFVVVLGPKGVRIAVTQTAFSQTGQQDSDYHITLPVSLSISDAVTRLLAKPTNDDDDEERRAVAAASEPWGDKGQLLAVATTERKKGQ